MLLGATMLKSVQNVNSFQTTQQAILRQNNPNTVYFRLVDLEQTDQYGQPLRYVPASGATLTATISSINADNFISRLATQPYSSDDRSIFALNILATDTVTTGNLDLQLMEGSTIRTTTVLSGIIVWDNNVSLCK